MAAYHLSRSTTNAEQRTANGSEGTLRHPSEHWSSQPSSCGARYEQSSRTPEKKQQIPSSLHEVHCQEGAGALLLVAAVHETGLLPTVETALSCCSSHAPSRFAHLSSPSRRSLLLTLLFLGAVGLQRTWDLRGYAGDALGLLTNRTRAYGYWHTERFLSQMAQANGADSLTDALAE